MTIRLIAGLTTAASLLWCVAVGFSSYVSYRELNSAFDRALREVAAALNLTDLAPILNLLRDLRTEGAIAGFQTPT